MIVISSLLHNGIEKQEICQWHLRPIWKQSLRMNVYFFPHGIHICRQAFFPRAYSTLHGGVLTVPQPTRSCLTSKITHFSKFSLTCLNENISLFLKWHGLMNSFLFQPVRFCNLNHESVFRKIFALLFLEALIPPTVDLIYTHGTSHNHNDCPRIMDVVLGSVILSCLRCWWGKE